MNKLPYSWEIFAGSIFTEGLSSKISRSKFHAFARSETLKGRGYHTAVGEPCVTDNRLP